MARPRTPTRVLEISGGYKGHADRKRARALEPQQDEALGDPPEGMDECERARWAEIQENAPDGVLRKRDRLIVEQLCKLWSDMRRGKLTMSGHRLLASLTAKLGLNPSDASKPQVKPKPAVGAAGLRDRYFPKKGASGT